MDIPGISDSLLNTAFVPSAEPQGVISSTEKHSKDMLFVASMTLYLKTFHEIVMNSWRKFAETEKQITKQKNESHRIHEARRAELEGQRKHTEAHIQEESGVHRQAGKFHFHIRDHIDHRHLNIPV